MDGSISEFLAMGGYAGFVWPAYLIAALVLAVLLASALHQVRRNEALLVQLRQMRRARPDTEEAAE